MIDSQIPVPTLWNQVDWLKKALEKFHYSSSSTLLSFEMLPNGASRPLMHLVLASQDNRTTEELYWYFHDSTMTLYYTVEPESNIPAVYRQINDGYNRSYVFTSITQLTLRSKKFHDHSGIVLLPTPNCDFDYWFLLVANSNHSKLTFELQGNHRLIPLSKQKKTNLNLLENQLPVGFIRRGKVYLFQAKPHLLLYIFEYIDIASALKVLDLTAPQFPAQVPLKVVPWSQFFLCQTTATNSSHRENGTVTGNFSYRSAFSNGASIATSSDYLSILLVFLLVVVYLLVVLSASLYCYQNTHITDIRQITGNGTDAVTTGTKITLKTNSTNKDSLTFILIVNNSE